jgi:hypothetical protein
MRSQVGTVATNYIPTYVVTRGTTAQPDWSARAPNELPDKPPVEGRHLKGIVVAAEPAQLSGARREPTDAAIGDALAAPPSGACQGDRRQAPGAHSRPPTNDQISLLLNAQRPTPP